MNRERLLTILIVIGLILGSLLGQFLHEPSVDAAAELSAHPHAGILISLEFFGMTFFMGLLKMLIIPLIAASVLVAVSSVGDVRVLGRLGFWTLCYYFGTMLIAAAIGLAAVVSVAPGVKLARSATPVVDSPSLEVTEELGAFAAAGVSGAVTNLLSLMIPENIFAAMAEGQTLPVIVFFIFFGVVLTMIGEQGERIVWVAEALSTAMMKMVELVLWLAPLGVFCLLTVSVAKVGLGVFSDAIGIYMLTVIAGLGFHAGIVLPLCLLIVARTNPFRFAYRMRAALLLAFGTSSSSATLPVTMETAVQQAGVSKRAAGLVLPLGSTINMDGTALYEAVAVVFLAQAAGIELGMTQLIIIAITATLAAVGAAGIPGAGLVTMVICVDAVNQSLLSVSPTAALIPVASIGMILGVDRPLDMLRTTANVWGDAIGAKIISKLDAG